MLILILVLFIEIIAVSLTTPYYTSKPLAAGRDFFRALASACRGALRRLAVGNPEGLL